MSYTESCLTMDESESGDRIRYDFCVKLRLTF